jgi:hypothetical protein
MNGPAEWIGEKLLAGIAGSIGSQIFSKFMDGIGIPDQQTQIFNLLNQVVARLAEIQKKLEAIEKAILQADYNNRAGKLWADYGQYTTIVDQMNDLNKLALANTGRDGKPIDAQVAKDVIDGAKRLKASIIKKDMTFVSDVHSAFLTSGEGSLQALPLVFAQVKWLDAAPIIDQGYFKLLNAQLERYRSFQAVVTSLLVDAMRTENATMAKVKLDVALKYINEEAVQYPAERALFKTKDGKLVYEKLVAQIADGKSLFDEARGVVWDLGYAHFPSCFDMLTYNKDRKKDEFMVASNERVRELIVDAKKSGVFSKMVKDLGFSQNDADGIQMITTSCTLGRVTFDWFGNDRSGPWDSFKDTLGQFEKVRIAKKMPAGLFTMKVTPLE